MKLLDALLRRPLATQMAFAALALLGAAALVRMPVELLPPLEAGEIRLTFDRPGAGPELVEREILQPLETGAARLPGLGGTWGRITGSSGILELRFEAGTDLGIRRLQVEQLAARVAREQPQGTRVTVGGRGLSAASQLALLVQVSGKQDLVSLRRLVEQRVAPRLAAVPGVGRVEIQGGRRQEVRVRIDPERAAAYGLRPSQVVAALRREVGRPNAAGTLRRSGERREVVVDGRPATPLDLGRLHLLPGTPVSLEHVAQVALEPEPAGRLFRVDGRPALAILVYQEEEARLVEVGGDLRRRLGALRQELAPLGVELEVGLDAAALVRDELTTVGLQGALGFLLALAVLLGALRQPRAVLVVGLAVPVSLLIALALLDVAGQTLNLVTLLGLALSFGMLVDNSVVSFEAIQRQAERGRDADQAVTLGLRRTVRAITGATATTAVVFLPLALLPVEPAALRPLLTTLAAAIILPLGASLLVAVGLVPLLARHHALGPWVGRTPALSGRSSAGAVFDGLLSLGLRHPAPWLLGVALAVVAGGALAVPWVVVNTLGAEEDPAASRRWTVETPPEWSLEATSRVFRDLEKTVARHGELWRVQSLVQPGGGLLIVQPATGDRERQPQVGGQQALAVAADLRRAGRAWPQVDLRRDDGAEAAVRGGGRGLGLGDMASGGVPGDGRVGIVRVSGPDLEELDRTARSVRRSLGRLPEVAEAWIPGGRTLDELWVLPERAALVTAGILPDEAAGALALLRRGGIELPVGITLPTGRELPLRVTVEGGREPLDLPLATPAGITPLDALLDLRPVPGRPPLTRRDGRREAVVLYRLADSAPVRGGAARHLEERLDRAVASVPLPSGYTLSRPAADPARRAQGFLVPVSLLLFAVLAVTFESLLAPLLVLTVLPATLVGALLGLAVSGRPADVLALAGGLALMGLTVNPAILLVDRIQQRRRGGTTAAAAAWAATRERLRPVLVTTATTVAALWPLALGGGPDAAGAGFASVVIGGLLASTLATLVAVPAGAVVAARVEAVLGRLGPWLLLLGLGVTAATAVTLGAHPAVGAWRQLEGTVLVAAGLFSLLFLLVRRRAETPRPEGNPPVVEVRHLRKTYGRPGPVRRALHRRHSQRRRTQHRNSQHRDYAGTRSPWHTNATVPLLLAAGSTALAVAVDGLAGRSALVLLAIVAIVLAPVGGRQPGESNDARPGGPRDRGGHGRARDGDRARGGGRRSRVEAALAGAVATAGRRAGAAWAAAVVAFHVVPRAAGGDALLPLPILAGLAAVLALAGWARRTARREVVEGRADGRQRPAPALRRLVATLFGFDLPRPRPSALAAVDFRLEAGMTGVLGPNGAGKTTLLRLLAGILEPSAGRVTLGGVELSRLGRRRGRLVGYLPQDFRLPPSLTVGEYLEYFGLLHDLPSAQRPGRIAAVLRELGLEERAGERIPSLSGGMRQRLALARTLLHQPPVVIVDEPVVGLDPQERIRFRNLLVRLARSRVVLFSTHLVEDVLVACSRVLVLSGGRIVFDGPPDDLAARAAGRVWQVDLPATRGEVDLPPTAVVLDRRPRGGGRRLRLLHDGPLPGLDGRPVEATLEDGYLALAGRRLNRSGGGGGEEGGPNDCGGGR